MLQIYIHIVNLNDGLKSPTSKLIDISNKQLQNKITNLFQKLDQFNRMYHLTYTLGKSNIEQGYAPATLPNQQSECLKKSLKIYEAFPENNELSQLFEQKRVHKFNCDIAMVCIELLQKHIQIPINKINVHEMYLRYDYIIVGDSKENFFANGMLHKDQGFEGLGFIIYCSINENLNCSIKSAAFGSNWITLTNWKAYFINFEYWFGCGHQYKAEIKKDRKCKKMNNCKNHNCTKAHNGDQLMIKKFMIGWSVISEWVTKVPNYTRYGYDKEMDVDDLSIYIGQTLKLKQEHQKNSELTHKQITNMLCKESIATKWKKKKKKKKNLKKKKKKK